MRAIATSGRPRRCPAAGRSRRAVLPVAALLAATCNQTAADAPCARFALYGPDDALLGEADLCDPPSAPGAAHERIDLRAARGPSVAVRSTLELVDGRLRRFVSLRRSPQSGDEVRIEQAAGSTRWRLQQGLAVDRRSWPRTYDGVVVDEVLPGFEPSASLVAWQALLRDRVWRAGQSLTLEVINTRRGTPTALQIAARELRPLTLDGRSIAAVRLFAHLPGAGHTIWVEQESGRLLAMDGVAGVRARRAGLQLPPPARLPLPASVVEEEAAVAGPQVALGGTFSHPAAGSRWPVIVLIHGSGPMDRDENAGGMFLDLFRTIAHRAGERGWAALRYDKRGVGASRFLGESHSATLDDLAGDVHRWLGWLDQRRDVDRECRVLIGHSEGGYLAPLVAVEATQVAGVVLLAGPASRLDYVVRAQQRLIMRAHGADAALIAASSRQQDALLRVVASGRDRMLETPGVADESARWLRSHLEHDPATVLQRLRAPLLAIYGGADLQVPRSEAEQLAGALPTAARERAAIVVLEGIDHLLMRTSGGGDLGWYADPDRALAPEVLDALLRWLESLPCRGAR
ncbi:MAG: alpha/beta fold hydrolase [Deltaproteobacteria bacterium]|nr:alpha/beta fold hydrolase [Deltaproteobacteria bacterium]